MNGPVSTASVAAIAGSTLLVAGLWVVAKVSLRLVRWKEVTVRIFGNST
jgi:hypothetical protein